MMVRGSLETSVKLCYSEKTWFLSEVRVLGSRSLGEDIIQHLTET